MTLPLAPMKEQGFLWAQAALSSGPQRVFEMFLPYCPFGPWHSLAIFSHRRLWVGTVEMPS